MEPSGALSFVWLLDNGYRSVPMMSAWYLGFKRSSRIFGEQLLRCWICLRRTF